MSSANWNPPFRAPWRTVFARRRNIVAIMVWSLALVAGQWGRSRIHPGQLLTGGGGGRPVTINIAAAMYDTWRTLSGVGTAILLAAAVCIATDLFGQRLCLSIRYQRDAVVAAAAMSFFLCTAAAVIRNSLPYTDHAGIFSAVLIALFGLVSGTLLLGRAFRLGQRELTTTGFGG